MAVIARNRDAGKHRLTACLRTTFATLDETDVQGTLQDSYHLAARRAMCVDPMVGLGYE